MAVDEDNYGSQMFNGLRKHDRPVVKEHWFQRFERSSDGQLVPAKVSVLTDYGPRPNLKVLSVYWSGDTLVVDVEMPDADL